MKDFFQWLVEMAGTGVVSPKPGADYQIWGAVPSNKRKKKRKKKKK
jgi:hypothetical protein